MGKYINIRSQLKLSLNDGLFHSLMVGVGESYIAAYALARGYSELTTNWIASLPLFVGALFQFISEFGVFRLNSYRKWVVAMAGLQSASLMALAVTALIDQVPAAVVFLLVSLYWGSSMATGPAWNRWLGDLVPHRIRGKYFSIRTMMCNLGILVGLVAGGMLLHGKTHSSALLHTFFFMFMAAGVFRGTSAGYLYRQHEEADPLRHDHRTRIFSALKRFIQSPIRRVLWFALSFNMAIFISAGFFAPYMLKHLQLSFDAYMGLLATAFVARSALLYVIRNLVVQKNLYKLLFLANFGIMPVPFLWTLSSNYLYLMLLQAVTGAFWAIYELVIFLLIFSHIKPQEKMATLSSYVFLQTVAMIVGASIGSWVFNVVGHNRDGYYAVFIVSTLARLATFAIIPHPKRHRPLVNAA